MKVLMTGCAGYLGSMLSKYLLTRNIEVVGLDLMLYDKDSVSDLLHNDNFKLHIGDIRDLHMLSALISEVDSVVHLASIVGAEASKLSTDQAVIINTLATNAIAQLCQMYKTKHLIFTSTASVYGNYGDKNNGSADERTDLVPVELYGETKVRSEKAIRENYDDPTILRLGTLFGWSKRMRFDLVVNLFTAKALLKEPLTVFGGRQVRPFLHIEDACSAIYQALTKHWIGTYNIAQDNYSIEQVAKIVERTIPSKITITDTIVDKRNYAVTCNKIKELGYVAEHHLFYGIEEIQNAFNNHQFTNYKEPRYSNHDSLFTDKARQALVYTKGAIV